MNDISKQKFVCVDCEATGLDPQNDRIVEIAVMLFDANEVYEQMESLIDPECLIPESSIAIHHITPEMVKGKPYIQNVLPEVLRLIGNHIIIGHGIKFDIDIISAAADRNDIPCSIRHNRYLDTLRMARHYGESPVNSLEQLRMHFNIPLEGAHRAMSDVIVNKEVFKFLSKQFRNTQHLFDVLSRPIQMSSMPFGKHKGRQFKEIPLQYLQWIVNKGFDDDLTFSVKTELKRRKNGNHFGQVNNPFLNL
ncbi:MAG: DUF3820 family protein [Parachlamydiaceae bacterium]|nr:DUF3820 family protein [Parachlamydiaceae bacterium]